VAGARRSALALAGLTLLAAGCGGGGLSHGAYLKHADAVCSAYSAKATKLHDATHYAEVVTYVDKDLPLYEAALDKLTALKPPADDTAAVRRWLAADRRVASAVRALGLAAQRHDFPAVSDSAGRVQQAEIESRRNAIALGLQVCGRA
jgi:hypothetical protein